MSNAERVRELSRYPHAYYAVDRWAETSEDGESDDRRVADLDEADVIASSIEGSPGMHTIMLDLDRGNPQLIPSSTPGHAHLYIDVPVDQDKLAELLDALASCGIIEPGYASVSKVRGYTSLRLPWVRKIDVPDLPDELEPF